MDSAIRLAWLSDSVSLLLMKLLQSIFKGRVSIRMRVVLNLEFWIPEIGNYVIILFGCAIIILMQSSSVTTPTLTSLVAVGLLRLEKTFPFTVGANVVSLALSWSCSKFDVKVLG